MNYDYAECVDALIESMNTSEWNSVYKWSEEEIRHIIRNEARRARRPD